MNDLRKKQLIDNVFKLSNIEEESSLWTNLSFNILKAKYPLLSASELDGIFKTHGKEAYLQLIRDLYDRQFTENDLEEITKFLLSNVGIKMFKGSFTQSQRQIAIDWAKKIEAECKNLSAGKK